jgi:hypothetical protein
MNRPTRVIDSLGYAGLIPFVVPALLLLGDFGRTELWQSIAGAYAFGIIAFLAGSWWGMALPPGTRVLLLLSNVYFLLALACYLLAPQWWPLAAAVLLLAIFLTEQNTALMPTFAHSYRKLRGRLTLIAGGSMLAVFIAA